MRSTWRIIAATVALIGLAIVAVPAASADPSSDYGTGGGHSNDQNGNEKAWIKIKGRSGQKHPRSATSAHSDPSPYALYNEYVKLLNAGNKAAAMHVLNQGSIAAGCGPYKHNSNCMLGLLSSDNPGPSPQQVAQQVIASVGYQSPDIGVAPNHSINHLTTPSGKALDGAVGYPNWFWAVGGTQTDQQVTKSADGMQVSLSIHVDSLTVDPGDGNTFTCVGMGTPWTSQVKPGTPSPTCGYTYFKTGTYAVRMTTKWTVHYKITGPGVNATGDIPIQGWHQRNLVIGELQTVVVH